MSFGFWISGVPAFASSSLNYFSSPDNLLSGAGTTESASYSVWNAIGGLSGTASSAAYSADFGFLSASATYSTAEITNLTYPATSEAAITNTVLNYPNPFNPGLGPTEIAYQLNSDINTTVYIFNVLGQLIWKRTYSSGTNGGKAGFNSISWNGTSDFGGMVANDIYLLRVVTDGKVLGRCKIAVLK